MTWHTGQFVVTAGGVVFARTFTIDRRNIVHAHIGTVRSCGAVTHLASGMTELTLSRSEIRVVAIQAHAIAIWLSHGPSEASDAAILPC
jgi:hypothetical protein